MIVKMYSIRDAKAEVYLQPFFAPNNAVALRMVSQLLKDRNTLFATNPEDYSLFYLGDFEDSNCKFDLPNSIVHIVNVIDLVKQD